MTKIEWCEETWNPITGCTSISEGCQNCYAKRMAQRLKGRFGYPTDDPFKVTVHPDRLEQPLEWKKSHMIFLCSMGDLFHHDVSMAYQFDIFQMMSLAPQHKYLVLTKRPMNMYKTLHALYSHPDSDSWPKTLPDYLWLGVTAENQKRADERIPILLQIPATKRFVSIEPMLEKIDLAQWLSYPKEAGCVAGLPISYERFKKLDWVICGAETGPDARYMEPEWAMNLYSQCYSAGIPFFFKKASKGDELDLPREYPK